MADVGSATDRWLGLARPRNWLLFLAAYLLLHMGMRLLLSDTLQLDDAEQLIQSQDWRLDYGNFQPPFYTWALWALWHVIEPSMAALYVIRYVIIGLTFWLWYRVSCQLFDDPRWIVASATSWLLLGEFAWKLHQGSTHTTLLTLALVMSLHAIVSILRAGSLRHYAYLGLANGLGMMAKYSYAGFVIPMLLAALITPSARERLLRWPILLTLAVAAVLMLPALLSLFYPDAPVEVRLQGQTSHHLGGLLTGDPSVLVEFVKGTAAFLAPLWLIYAALFQLASRGAGDSVTPLPAPAGDGWEGGRPVRRLLNRFHLLVLLGVLGISLFVGIDHLKSRWLHPFLTLVPFWWLQHAAPRRHAWPVLKWLTVGLVVLVVAARAWQLLASPYVGHKPSRVTWPVSEALEMLPPEVLASPRLRVADPYLGVHVRILAHRKVIVSLPQTGEQDGGIWLWGGVEKDLPASVKQLQQGPGLRPHWYHATRGRAGYWIGCVGSRPEDDSLCGSLGVPVSD